MMRSENRKTVCMIAYTNYATDGRVRLEAETLTRWGYSVVILVPKKDASPNTSVVEGVTVQELSIRKYRSKSNLSYMISYFTFLILAFFACTRLFFQGKTSVVHVHN